MGIDARIVLRNVRSVDVNDEQLLDWSRRLCRAVGAQHFWLIRPESPTAAKTGRRHAISRTCEPLSWYDGQEPGSIYLQDGPDVLARTGECLLQVNVGTRWYGVGYERGDLLGLCAVAEACELIVPRCEVWYGGDSSGVVLEPFPSFTRLALRRHLFSDAGREYFDRFGENLRKDEIEMPECSLCLVPMIRNGWGQGFAACTCGFCGHAIETRDSGATWADRKEDLR